MVWRSAVENAKARMASSQGDERRKQSPGNVGTSRPPANCLKAGRAEYRCVAEHLRPQPALAARGVALEWDQREGVHRRNRLQVLRAGVALVCCHFLDGEVLGSGLDHFRQQWGVVGVAPANDGGGHDVRLHARHRVDLHPIPPRLLHPVLLVIPPHEFAGGKARRIWGERGFYHPQRQAALDDQRFQHRG